MRVQRSPFKEHSMAPSQGCDDVGNLAETRTQNWSGGSSSSACGSNSPSWSGARGHLLRAGALWLLGFKEACQFHRALSFFKRSRPVLMKTGQCFLLNGCLFLGSILILQNVVVPTLRWFLGSSMQMPGEKEDSSEGGWRTAGVLQNVVVGICYVFWLYPLYIISFVVNSIWYNDIAKHAFRVIDGVDANNQKNPAEVQSASSWKGSVPAKGRPVTQNNSGIQSTVLQIGEQIYSVIMVSVFFMEVFAVTYVPYVGRMLNFVLLSWLYAYYCFDYKWGFARWSLERRILFFETNWAFFAGFGSPCVLATFFLSPFVSAGVMNILFPLFVLVATASNPEEVMQKCLGMGNSPTSLKRLPIFYLANNLTIPLLGLLQPAASTMPSAIQSRSKGQ